ncbi:hypothetical protein OB2597_15110 [Pseudooceanicola batsensis HTCC2597]|uniref:Uncharacterized protein n=1 Tax=Pseudooceanicola batsensis (strain ATCC BAA-863 / DSM 15984 / KCTC 12145 / HTCC2597) TaxID=252305 RepID=A3TYQ4_PSEBH|nr:hypothetical protein [Pseudooceanicola batsensis]EAQ02722.1 hypothetical protein OB2597_15110 [Pseudooceanicola batsensis HTCC2597]
MSRLILVLVLIAAVVAAASLIAAAFARPSSASGPEPARRTSAIQKAAYGLLIAVMTGVAAGWLGAE